MCDMTLSYVWFIHPRDKTRSNEWNNLFACVTWLIHICDMTDSCVWGWLVWGRGLCAWGMCDMTHPYVWHDAYSRCVWHYLQHVPEKIRLEMVIGMPNEILNTSISCFFWNEPFKNPLWSSFKIHSHSLITFIHHIPSSHSFITFLHHSFTYIFIHIHSFIIAWWLMDECMWMWWFSFKIHSHSLITFLHDSSTYIDSSFIIEWWLMKECMWMWCMNECDEWMWII